MIPRQKMTLISTVTVLGLLAQGGLGGLSAIAGVNVQTHVPTANTSYVKTESPATDSEYAFVFGADYNFSNDPLVELNRARTRRIGTLLESVQTLDLTVAKGLSESFALGASLPVHNVRLPTERSEMTLGDARLFSKIALTRANSFLHLALIPELWLPTGSESLFMSDGSVGYGGRIALERNFGLFTAAANVGYRRSNSAQFRDIDYRHRVPISLAVGVPFGRRWAMNLEANGSRSLPLNTYQNPAEFYAGFRHNAAVGLALTGGASLGSTNSISSQDYRVLLGLRWTPVVKAEPRLASDRIQMPKAKSQPIQFSLDEEILFAHDSDRLLPRALPILDRAAFALMSHRDKFEKIAVEGHCNELGTDAYNDVLSRKRARSVARYFASKGIPEEILLVHWFGESRPKAIGASYTRKERLRINRRVEIKLVQ